MLSGEISPLVAVPVTKDVRRTAGVGMPIRGCHEGFPRWSVTGLWVLTVLVLRIWQVNEGEVYACSVHELGGVMTGDEFRRINLVCDLRFPCPQVGQRASRLFSSFPKASTVRKLSSVGLKLNIS